MVTRPVCRAKSDQSPNEPLADLVGELLNPFIEEADSSDRTEVISTEELCHKTEAANGRIARAGLRAGPFQQDVMLVIGSMDADKFYPNLDIDQTAEEVKQEIIESKAEIEGVNTDEVALFLACSMTQAEIDSELLTDVVHKSQEGSQTRPDVPSPHRRRKGQG